MASVEFFDDQQGWSAEPEEHESPLPAGSGPDPSVAERSLATAVDELRVLEDQTSALARDARRTLRAAATVRLLHATGFGSPEELEGRLMAGAPTLGLVLACATSGRRTASRPGSGSRRGGPRPRDGRALEAVSAARKHLREVEEEVVQVTDAARALLSTIERDRLYEDCGYLSLEDFLERALGPRPLLSAVMMLGGASAPTPEEASSPSEGSFASGAEDSFFEAAAEPGEPALSAAGSLSGGAASVDEALVAEPSPGSPVTPGRKAVVSKPASSTRTTILLSVALALLAAAGGAAAGRRGSLAGMRAEPSAAQVTADVPPAGPAPPEPREAKPQRRPPAPQAKESVHRHAEDGRGPTRHEEK